VRGQPQDLLDPLLPARTRPATPSSSSCSNPFDVDIPLVDVDLLGSTSEVTANDDEVTADAQATLAGVNVLGLACVGGDGTDRSDLHRVGRHRR
jgi:hypothetical protein